YANITANLVANRIQSATAVAVSYTNISDLFEKVETSNFWADSEMRVIAHPAYRAKLRNILDTQNRPIFTEAQSQAAGTPDQLLGVPIAWSLGARLHATATDAPTGNPLLFVGNAAYLIRGERSGPEYMLAGADSGPAFLTDEALLKVRSRRGFNTGQLAAWAVLEDIP
ncbi:MAG: phage major capsid protein, partial [Pseudonocardiaceae bacterium]